MTRSTRQTRQTRQIPQIAKTPADTAQPWSRRSAVPLAGLLLCAGLSGCSSIESVVAGDKIDYRSAGTKAPSLEVPPDLTQLSNDARYQQQGGSFSAATFQAGPTLSAMATPAVVAPGAIDSLRIERQGGERWLSTQLTPEQLWPQLQAFWKERGFNLVTDQADVGVMETDWAENRAKLPQDLIRSTLGRVIDSLYSTGERDKFRTRVERSAKGTEVYISHRGMEEVYTSQTKDSTVWQPRKADPELEAEMLQRLLVKLGAKQEQAKTLVATSATGAAQGPAKARVLPGQAAATLQVDDGFDRAWRRVGLALDRSGFTVEDRDRTQGLYYVRYVDPAQAGKDEPGFFGKLFSFGKSNDASAPVRYRVSVKGQGEQSAVSVLTAQGNPENGTVGQRIVALLVDDLK